MDGSHHPSSTQLHHQQQLFGLLARSKQGAKVEKSPSSIWGISKEVSTICPPRAVFWYLAARVTSLLVASQRCCCRVLMILDLIDCGMAFSRRSKLVQCRFGMSHTCGFQLTRNFETSTLNFANSHRSIPTFWTTWSDPISMIQCHTQVVRTLEFHSQAHSDFSLTPSCHSSGTCHFQLVSLTFWCRSSPGTYFLRSQSVPPLDARAPWDGNTVMLTTYHPLAQKAACTILQCEMQEPGTEDMVTKTISTTEWLDAPKTLIGSGPLLREAVEIRSVWAELLSCFVSFRFSTSLRGARNVPLFDDEARALVGTDFKRKGRYEVPTEMTLRGMKKPETLSKWVSRRILRTW